MLAVAGIPRHNAPMTTTRLRRRAFRTAIAMTAVLLSGCGTESSSRLHAALPSPNAKALATALVGNYTNADQVTADPSFEGLEFHACPIWPDRIDGLWVYIEGSRSGSPEKPYRQRIYQIVDGNNASSVDARMYEFPTDPAKFAGAWKNPHLLEEVTPFLLIPRAGCTTTFHTSADGSWVGTMRPTECATDWKGAAYSVSDVTLTKSELSAWDRGYDASGKEVWAATKAPIKFTKIR